MLRGRVVVALCGAAGGAAGCGDLGTDGLSSRMGTAVAVAHTCTHGGMLAPYRLSPCSLPSIGASTLFFCDSTFCCCAGLLQEGPFESAPCRFTHVLIDEAGQASCG